MKTLIKYIASAGVVARRKAVEAIKAGKVTVNNIVIVQPWHTINDTDIVRYDGKKIVPEQEYIYIIVNKPAGYITTTADEAGRPTVMKLVKNATRKRIVPVGRLDQDTTGILLLTNDGELANKLIHPRYAIKKTYQVQLDRPLDFVDERKLVNGVRLTDGIARCDALKLVSVHHRRRCNVTIHSGKKRIIRRMFGHVGYDVQKLDRVQFAGISKKGLIPGTWRHATKAEIAHLKKITTLSKKD